MKSELTSLSAILSADVKGYNISNMVTLNSSVDEIYQFSKLYT